MPMCVRVAGCLEFLLALPSHQLSWQLTWYCEMFYWTVGALRDFARGAVQKELFNLFRLAFIVFLWSLTWLTRSTEIKHHFLIMPTDTVSVCMSKPIPVMITTQHAVRVKSTKMVCCATAVGNTQYQKAKAQQSLSNALITVPVHWRLLEELLRLCGTDCPGQLCTYR